MIHFIKVSPGCFHIYVNGNHMNYRIFKQAKKKQYSIFTPKGNIEFCGSLKSAKAKIIDQIEASYNVV